MKQQEQLTGRQKDILQTIINTHITTASTVGSRTVARAMGFRLSPASIRNVMADLEEMRYVRQPHTSAGRIPTDSGYRVYVDTLMEIAEVNRQEQVRIDRHYELKIKEIEDLMLLSSRLLSLMTHYAAVVQTPRTDTEAIKHVDIVPLTADKALVIMVTNLGDVRKCVTLIPAGTLDSELERLSIFLNEKLHALPFSAARSLLDSFEDSTDPSESGLASLAQNLLKEVLSEEPVREIFLDGRENMFDQPEFRNPERLRPVLRALDEKRQLNELIDWCVSVDEADVSIRIGSENPLNDVRNCSIVVSPYRICGRTTGAIGLIGPTRMWYSRASSLVAYVAHKLSEILTELSGGE